MKGNPVTLRLLSQELAAPRYSDPAEVVRHFGAMQAQEYRLMRWAVAMRTRRPSYAAFRDAFDSGRIVRLHLLRGTWQLVAGEDYRWMLALCAPKAERVIRGWMSANGISIPSGELLRVRDILLSAADSLGSATKEDFAEALAARGITMDDHRLSYHIRLAELSGDLCSGNLLPQKATYALSARKIQGFGAPASTSASASASGGSSGLVSDFCRSTSGGGRGLVSAEYPGVPLPLVEAEAGLRAPASTSGVPLPSVEAGVGFRAPADRDEALALLARKYFQSHSPATFADFVWWSGLSVADCRRGVDLLGSHLLIFDDASASGAPRAVSAEGQPLYILDSCRTRGFRGGRALLLPPYDEYLIGYKSRGIVLPEAFRARAHNQSGNFYPVVAHDGLICGNWSPFRPDLTIDFFRPDDQPWTESACWSSYRRASGR